MTHDIASPAGIDQGIDPGVPSPARIYDYYLGGKDNFAADREAAEKALSVVPQGREVAWRCAVHRPRHRFPDPAQRA